MDEFERLEAGLSRDLVPKKWIGRQAIDTLMSCWGEASEEEAPFVFKEEPIAATLLASTKIVLDAVTSITNGLSYLFLGASKPEQASAQEAPLEVVIDMMPVLVDSPRLTEIQSSEIYEKPVEIKSPTVEDYDGNGFWEDHLDDSVSENGSFYGVDSYIDPSLDSDIIMQPIAKKSFSGKKQTKVRFEPIIEFMNSAVINDRVVIKAYLQGKRFDVNVRDKIGYTLLHYASAHGHADLVKYLLEQGADINLPETEGWTALHFAAIADQLKVCKVLIDKGANVESPNLEGLKPIQLTDNVKIKKLIEDALKKKLSAKKLYALYDWDAEGEEDLTIKRGQVLKVKERFDDWWLVQNDSKEAGLVPRIFIQ